VTNVELEGRLRSAASTYERLAATAPDLERRIFERIALTLRNQGPQPSRVGSRSWAIQLLAAAALVAFAVAMAVLVREARLFREPQPVTTPTPNPQSLSVTGPGGWKYSAGRNFGPMVTPTIGWNLGAGFTRTTDGGAHWTDVAPPGLNNSAQIDYLDATHAWITEELGNRLITFRTDDGGRTWQQGVPITPIASDAPNSYGIGGSRQLDFVDPMHGWLLASPTGTSSFSLYRTNDGGLDWQVEAVNSVAANHKASQFGCDRFCSMAFASPSTGWITTIALQARPSLLVTHDGGVTWKLQTLLPTTTDMGCPCYVDTPIFSDQDHGILMLWRTPNVMVGHLLVTSDGGSTWTTRSLPDEAVWQTVGFYDANHGWVIAGPATVFGALVNQTSSSQELPAPLYRTDDGGKTWVRVQTNLTLQSTEGSLTRLIFVDQGHGFATWSFSSGRGFTGFQFLKTSDGGRTWSVVFTNRSP
jgi:photosystem II stability/assembly factor-like uncharacterized protein